jgi:hypothetical protein
MPYSRSDGTWANVRDVTPIGSQTVTANVNGPGIEVGGRTGVRLTLAVAGSVSGTSPTLNAQVQTSMDNGATDAWRNVGSATSNLTGAGSIRFSVAGLDRWMRVVLTVGGTSPSFGQTSVVGELGAE